MALVKTEKEIASIEEACRITDEIFREIVGDFCFTTERELALFIRRAVKRRGLREAFPPIVTSGPRAGDSIHPKYTDAKMKGFVIIDFGVRVDGYCSDMTRTVYVGKPSEKDRMLYKLVADAKAAGERVARAGASCALADKAARDSFGTYKKYFIHTLGHGVGRHIHELPHIFYKRDGYIFAENSVVTIEPGIYLPGKFGIRIEDTYVVGKKGLHALTNSPQKLLVFP
jgi:Xaa-Pro aminopeptidase